MEDQLQELMGQLRQHSAAAAAAGKATVRLHDTLQPPTPKQPPGVHSQRQASQPVMAAVPHGLLAAEVEGAAAGETSRLSRTDHHTSALSPPEADNPVQTLQHALKQIHDIERQEARLRCVLWLLPCDAVSSSASLYFQHTGAASGLHERL